MNEFHLGEPVVYVKNEKFKRIGCYTEMRGFGIYGLMLDCFPMTAPFLYSESMLYMFILYCDNCPHAIFEIIFYILHEL